MRAATFVVVLGLLLLAACPRPPVDPPPPDVTPLGPVDLAAFVQDRPAVAGKWYAYNPDGHTLDPKPDAYIVRVDDGAGGIAFHALRVLSVYEPDGAESGRFTFARSHFDDAQPDDPQPGGGQWSEEVEWVTARNFKLTGPLCVNLANAGGGDGSGDDVDCTGTGWDLRFAIFQYFSPLSAFTVTNPGIFARSVAATEAFGTVRIARVDGATSSADLPDPTTLPLLVDGPTPTPASTDWDFAAFAPDLPVAGLAIGDVARAPIAADADDVWFMLTSRAELVRFAFHSTAPNNPAAPIVFRFARVAFDRDTLMLAAELPDDVEVTVPAPGPQSARYLRFDGESTGDTPLGLSAADLEGVVFPHLPPKTTHFDLALVRVQLDSGSEVVRALASPATAVVNATARGFDTVGPPLAASP